MEMLLLIVVLILLVIVLWAIFTINKFKRLDIKVDEALSGIEVALEKRYDMLTKLLDAAKVYITHEKEVFNEVINLHKGMSVEDLKAADQKMNNVTGGLLALAEGYPELRSSEVFVSLEEGIKDAEEHLQAARRVYNANVSAYNTALAMFPSSLLKGARLPRDFYEIEDHKREDVKISI